MIKHVIIASLLASAALGGYAQSDETMYLIKGDRVVAKYNVDDVDYASFELPEGVIDDPIWLNVDNVGKNSVTYTVNTAEQTETYAHGIVSYWDANYAALDNFGDSFENVTEDQQIQILQALLPYVGYRGLGTNTYTQRDYTSDGTGGTFTVHPNTKYFLCAWQIDPITEGPLEIFVWTEFQTLEPAQSSATVEVNFLRQNSEGLAFEFKGSNDVVYLMTAWGMKDVMEPYVETYGLDMLMGMFGQTFTIEQLQGPGEFDPAIEFATWPAYETGDYVLYVRAFDANGDVYETKVNASFVAPEADGPAINVLSRSKGDGSVSFNFEITPSNVDEAYVRLMDENDVDDMINDGWTLAELAASASAIDISSQINSFGEYTFTANNLDQKWYSIIVFAKNSDGKIAQRFNFYPDNETEWADYKPVYVQGRKGALKLRKFTNSKPAMNKVKL